MSVTINAKGTSIPYFRIGKNGSTLYQGTANPAQTYTVATGDVWFDTSSNSLKFRSSNSWISGTGTVTDLSVVTANGVSGTVANSTSTPAITLTLGAITPTSVAATGSVTGSNLSGTNTGDQTITLTGDVTGSGTGSFAATLATVNSSPQTDTFRKITVNGKGLVTATSAVSSSDITSVLGYTPVNRAGDTMTGTLNLPANGLTVGTTQLAAASGNIGIGTSSPEYRLDVNGTVRSVNSSGGALLLGDSNNTAAVRSIPVSGDSAIGFYTQALGANNERMRIDASGNVGIGTTATTGGRATIAATANYGDLTTGYSVVLSNAAGTGSNANPLNVGVLQFGNPAVANNDLGRIAVVQENPGSSTASSMRFYANSGGGNTQNLERMRIDATGIRAVSSFAVGDSSGNLSGVMLNESDTSKSVTFAADPGNVGASSFMRFNVDGTERMRIDSVGNITFSGVLQGSGASLTDLNAGQLTSGTVPAARIGTGTVYGMADGSTIGGLEIGYKNIPRGADQVINTAKRGRVVVLSSGVTIPSATFAADDTIALYNNTAGALIITQGSNLTMYGPNASTGNRTLAARGWATIWFNSASECKISGEVT